MTISLAYNSERGNYLLDWMLYFLVGCIIYLNSEIKLKCTLVQALRLCTGRTAHRGSRGTAVLIHDHGTRRGWGVSVTSRPLFTPGKDPVPIVQEAGWAPGPVWTGVESLAPPGFDPRTVQPVASRYTDWATRPTNSAISALELHGLSLLYGSSVWPFIPI